MISLKCWGGGSRWGRFGQPGTGATPLAPVASL